MVAAEFFFYSASIAIWLFIIFFLVVIIQYLFLARSVKNLVKKITDLTGTIEAFKRNLSEKVIEVVGDLLSNLTKKEVKK